MKQAMRGTRFAHVRWVVETGSTNDDLLRAASTGGREQALITDLQTAGRGRRDRVWEAPSRSSVLMSVLVRNRRPSDAFWAVAAVALGAAEAVSEQADIECTLKWPNDLMVGDAKVAGVLAQLVDDAAVIGIGINVNWPATMPETLGAAARKAGASVDRATGQRSTALNHHRANLAHLDRGSLVVAILTQATNWLEAGQAALHEAWKRNCSTLGSHVRLELATRSIVGIARDITENGALVIEHDGQRSSYEVGDVVHLRATL